jgi:hypothetical protein
MNFISDEELPIEYIDTSELQHELKDPRQGRSPAGYLNQGVAKLAFWKTGLVKNYVVLDAPLIQVSIQAAQDS